MLLKLAIAFYAIGAVMSWHYFWNIAWLGVWRQVAKTTGATQDAIVGNWWKVLVVEVGMVSLLALCWPVVLPVMAWWDSRHLEMLCQMEREDAGWGPMSLAPWKRPEWLGKPTYTAAEPCWGSNIDVAYLAELVPIEMKMSDPSSIAEYDQLAAKHRRIVFDHLKLDSEQEPSED
jgi:hypothetical protein